MLVRYLLSCLIDADRLDAADFDSPENLETRQFGNYVTWRQLIKHFENHLRQFKIRHEIDLMRRDISGKCRVMAEQERGFFRLSVPTGGGKTMASLRFALHHAENHSLQRIVYVIPYTSIIDQNARSIREALGVSPGDTRIVLEHHSNLTPNNDEESDRQHEEDYARFKLLADNWDSPIILTTMVQFLETLYGAGTNSCRRMHSLTNAVIIFDEIQTLPVNQVHLFNLAVKFLVRGCGSSIMLCTATQPLLHDLKVPARALPFDAKREISVREEQKRNTLDRVGVIDYTRPQGWKHNEVVDLALEEFDWKRSVLIIVNTKHQAANIYSHLSKSANIPTYHLSTKMCPAHRMEKLSTIIGILDKKEPFVLVSTQLIEAGVDVDFDVVIRFLAGIDSIAQAAGRCNRHGSKPYKGRVILVNSNEEKLVMLPDIAVAQEKTRRILEEFASDNDSFFQGHLLSDPALERYFQYYFFERSNEMDYPLDQTSLAGRSDTLVDLLSSNAKSVQAYRVMHKNQYPNRILNQSFRTASKSFQVIPDAGQGVIVPYGEGVEIVAELAGAFEPKKQFGVLRKAQRFSVSCFAHELMRLEKAQALHEIQEGSRILYLDNTFYHEELGWTYERSSIMPILNIGGGI